MIDEIKKSGDLWRRFTREEEHTPPFVDRYGRFQYRASSERDILEPSVSRYLHERGLRFEGPDGQPFAICLTHDVDIVDHSARSKGFDALASLASGQFAQTITSARNLAARRPPWLSFRDIMALEERYGARSSFYFLALSPGEQDRTYGIEDLEPEIGAIADAGWEVGLHGGHRAFAEPQALAAEKQRLEKVLGQEVVGYRNHQLRFRIPDTWESLSRAGFRYDSTMGFADCAGFRNGMCHPFRPYDLHGGREIDILEIPLAVIDGTLFRSMMLDHGSAWELTRGLIDAAERYNGAIAVLWHNHNMYGEELRFYEKLLGYCRDRGAWMTTGAEIEARWRSTAGGHGQDAGAAERRSHH